MKKFFKVGVILLIAAMMVMACTFEDEPEVTEKSGVDFKSYDGDAAAIFVRNDTNVRLVAFKSDIRADALLGGVPKGPGITHGLQKKSSLFPAGQAVEFPMVLITEADYIKHKSKLSEAAAFSRVYVLYNSQAENTKHYTISGILGGNQKINLIGNANYDIEWREDGIEGPTLGYAPRNMFNTNLMIQPGDYLLFPVFKYYNNLRNRLETIFPTVGSGNDRGYWFEMFSAKTPGITIQLDPSQALNALNNTKTLGVAWLVVNNNTTTGVQMRQGNVLYTDPMGYSVINNSEPLTLQIDMAEIAGSFATTRTVGGLFIGAAGRTKQVTGEDGVTTSFTLNTDTAYQIDVNGTVQDNNFTAVFRSGSGDPISFN